MIIINIVVYYDNKSFISSISDYINSHKLSIGIFPTDNWERAKESLKKDLKSILVCSKRCTEKIENRVVYLVDNEKDDGIYIYQPCNMLIKDIEKIHHSFKEEVKVVSFLIPCGFDLDFDFISAIAKNISESGKKTVIIDTNPCRQYRRDEWDLKTKRIMDGNLSRGDLDYYDGFYYIKPYSFYEDYYSQVIDLDAYIKKISNTGFFDSVLFINYMNKINDLSLAADITSKRMALFYSSGYLDEKLVEDLKKANYEIVVNIAGVSEYMETQTNSYDYIFSFDDTNKLDQVIRSINEAMI